MASVSKRKSTSGVVHYYIQLSPHEDKKRPKIYPSIYATGDSRKKIEKAEHEAATVKRHIEDLIEHKNGGRLREESELWLGGIGITLRKRLEELGLVKPKAKETKAGWSVAEWIADYITRRPDVKPGTKRKWKDVEGKLNVFFKTDKVDDITVQQAKNFRIYLQTTVKLSENTLRRHIGIARQFFNAAVDAEIITKNPFRGQRVSVQANESRFFYVSKETAQAVLQACPDAEWRLIFGLARFGGLRCPSEVLGLKWTDIDFDRQRFTVHAVKTEHHADSGIRIVPMFPELRPLFQDAFEQAREGAVYCIERYRGNEVNLRTQLGRIIKLAGLELWPKLFQNMRSTRETELFRMTSGNVKAVCSWMGNSPAVALAHYAQITEADFQQAAEKTILAKAEGAVGACGGHGGGESGCKRVQDENKESAVNAENAVNCGKNGSYEGSENWAKQDSNL